MPCILRPICKCESKPALGCRINGRFRVYVTRFALSDPTSQQQQLSVFYITLPNLLQQENSMLAPLDTRILDALSHDADDDEERDYDPHDHIGIVKALIAKNRNWSQGILRLLSFWPTMDPAFYRKKPLSTSHPLYNKGGPNNWWIAFHVRY